jgi:hypothetical protein
MLQAIVIELQQARNEYERQSNEYGVFSSNSDMLVDQAQDLTYLIEKISKITEIDYNGIR